MFPGRYFPSRYFAARYWPPSGVIAVPDAASLEYEVQRRQMHHEADSIFHYESQDRRMHYETDKP